MAPVSPEAGDVFEFLYGFYTASTTKSRHRFCHRFYNDFPYGRRVAASEAYVDMHITEPEVLEVRRATFNGEELVGVQFQAHNGMLLWTNFSKGDVGWLRLLESGCQPESSLECQRL